MPKDEIGRGVGFDRIRRITGYLVGTTARWNNAKRAEERERDQHRHHPQVAEDCREGRIFGGVSHED